MPSEAQRKASAKYDKEHTRMCAIKLNIESDKDILDALDDVADKPGGKQGYIKQAIREKIVNDG